MGGLGLLRHTEWAAAPAAPVTGCETPKKSLSSLNLKPCTCEMALGNVNTTGSLGGGDMGVLKAEGTGPG